MDNKIIGIVIGVLILGGVIFSGINNPELSAPMELNFKDKIGSTGLTNPEVIQTTGIIVYGHGGCRGIEDVTFHYSEGGVRRGMSCGTQIAECSGEFYGPIYGDGYRTSGVSC